GFALLDVWELCTAYYVKANHFSRKAMESVMADAGLRPGVLYRRDVAEYAEAYRLAHQADGEARPTLRGGIAVQQAASMAHPVSMVVAGSAGGKVRSAARLVAEAAIRSGLWATQRDDYPVTVQSGHSLAELVLSPEEMPLLNVRVPDVLVLLSEDGLRRAAASLARMRPEGVVLTLPELGGIETPARVEVLDPAAAGIRLGKGELALAMLAAAVARLELLPAEALRDAAAGGPYGEANLTAVEAGLALAGR
ncbi:MAG TPA: 2-oxoacid:acceptor oxidoreductase family protein, partial [Candidatus Limnocylindria bacterium]